MPRWCTFLKRKRPTRPQQRTLRRSSRWQRPWTWRTQRAQEALTVRTCRRRSQRPIPSRGLQEVSADRDDDATPDKESQDCRRQDWAHNPTGVAPASPTPDRSRAGTSAFESPAPPPPVPPPLPPPPSPAPVTPPKPSQRRRQSEPQEPDGPPPASASSEPASEDPDEANSLTHGEPRSAFGGGGWYTKMAIIISLWERGEWDKINEKFRQPLGFICSCQLCASAMQASLALCSNLKPQPFPVTHRPHYTYTDTYLYIYTYIYTYIDTPSLETCRWTRMQGRGSLRDLIAQYEGRRGIRRH